MSTTLDYLIPDLRLRIGDTDSTAYRFLDVWLLSSLESAVRYLSRFWSYKYVITTAGVVTRNTTFVDFVLDETTYGTIQQGDDSVITLVAALLLLQGDFQKSSYGYVSWRDAEISVSMQSAERSQDVVLKNLIAELNSLMTPPMKRLARALKNSLPGFNPSGASGYEKQSKY